MATWQSSRHGRSAHRLAISKDQTGVEEDAGRWRLTFFHGGRALRLIVDAEGTILSRATFPARLPQPETDGMPDRQG